MDGRVQLPVIKYLKQRFNAEYVDTITEPGPNLILANDSSSVLSQSIFARLQISVLKHKSEAVAIVGHYDCAGNPAPEKEQFSHIKKSIKILKKQLKDIEIIGLWVDKNWKVKEIE